MVDSGKIKKRNQGTSEDDHGSQIHFLREAKDLMVIEKCPSSEKVEDHTTIDAMPQDGQRQWKKEKKRCKRRGVRENQQSVEHKEK
jgi:hypothetical protein